MVESNIGLAENPAKIDVAQTHIYSILYGIASVGDRKIPDIQDSLQKREYISPNNWEQFQTPECINF